MAGLTFLLGCEAIAPRVTAPPNPSPTVQIVVSPESVALDPQQTQQFRAFGRTAAGDSVSAPVTWSASTGTVTQSGMYTADTSASDVVVTASFTDAPLTGTARVKKRRLVQVLISPTTVTLPGGGAQQFRAYGRKNTGDSVAVNVTYAATGGTITPTGMYTAGQSSGSFRVIAAQSGGSLADTGAVTVTTIPVASVSVSPATVSLSVGGTQQLTATPKDSAGSALGGRAVTWLSSAPSVATVSGSGAVRGVAPGSATITATSEGKTGSATVTVTAVPVATVTVSPAALGILVGGTGQLTATPKDAAGNPLSGRAISWTTSAPLVATVSAGVVTGGAVGTATITATSEGMSGTSTIAVSAPPPPGSCAPVYGSFAVGNWAPTCWQPYDPNSWHNLPLPANPQADANSAAIVAALNSHGLPMDKGAGVANDYDHPIYWSTASDPVYTLSGCGYSGALNGVKIHAIKGMVKGGGSDAHLTVMDQSTNMEWDFWQATIDDNAQTLGGHACGRLPIFGDGRINGAIINGPDGDGANAANTGLYTGQIRAVEIVAGVIKHPIAITVTCTNGTNVYPATGNALGCGSSSEPADGQVFQLTYSDVEIDALPVAAWKKTVLHAMHQYGFYVDDTGAGSASSPVSMQFHFESDKMFQAFGYEDPFVTYAKAHLGQDITQSGSVYNYQIAPGVDWSSRLRQLPQPGCDVPHSPTPGGL
ncbi:MAG: hypothetical protein AUH31_06195 [Armatimonadetes bacterium 13_1_40CM_64_14]|nr:MAG: hypothetical protein AUH31_06195 [Armatimonadetes bacterium 13_1_40CM_64_14]